MATPSSSATTPSPRPSYLAASPAATPASISSRDSTLTIKEERQRAIQRFFANAELSQLARGLRTRLSYASFKATHNLAHTTLPDLEAKAASPKSATNKLAGHGATPGSSANAQTSSRGLTRKGTMPPPPPVTASATQSLFSSLLQPPPSKRARTIHNPEDPPVPPPTKPKPVTPPRKSPSKTTRAPGSSTTASKSKSRKDTKGKKKETGNHAGPSSRLITPQTTLGSEDFAENDDDMKAAATLTSLLLSRPSMSGSASSPRSSLSAASDAGSSHSFSHYAQSSARTTVPSSVPLSHEGTFPGSFPRSKTPPAEIRHARTQSLPHVSNYSMKGNTTPKAQARPSTSRLANSSTLHPPSDTEAADLMLFLATSPSPARPSTSKEKEAKDMAAFRSLGGQPALKGRVLFPSSASGPEERVHAGPKPLRRDPTGSFNSTLSVATELNEDTVEAGGQERLIGVPRPPSPLNPQMMKRSRSDSTTHLNVPAPPTVIPPTPTDDIPAPLLPAPSSPGHIARPRAISEQAHLERAASLPAPSFAPPTPSNMSFNLNDFINVSPSPATQGASAKLTSLRANVGRKLFEEHQGMGGGAVGSRDGLSGHAGPGGLGAGIDLVDMLKSSV